MKELGYSAHEIELSKVAGYMHDIGNSINRNDHAHSGAIMAYQILKERKMPLADAITVATAIGQHDEATGTAVDPVSAEKKVIQMELEMDDSMCTVMDYFEIFLQRMLMCKSAAEVLGCRFKFLVNGNKLC